MATYIIYKPFGMLSQFTKEILSHVTLADLDYDFEKDVYPVGRLDADSEGLLLLSNDKALNDRILNPKRKQPKTYWAQVEGIPTVEALKQLEKGVTIRAKGKTHKCLPAKAGHLHTDLVIPDRDPPIRYREQIPTSWMSITLIEGKNRQVRKMWATVGYPVLRLIRAEIADYRLGVEPLTDITPGVVIPL